MLQMAKKLITYSSPNDNNLDLIKIALIILKLQAVLYYLFPGDAIGISTTSTIYNAQQLIFIPTC